MYVYIHMKLRYMLIKKDYFNAINKYAIRNSQVMNVASEIRIMKYASLNGASVALVCVIIAPLADN